MCPELCPSPHPTPPPGALGSSTSTSSRRASQGKGGTHKQCQLPGRTDPRPQHSRSSSAALCPEHGKGGIWRWFGAPNRCALAAMTPCGMHAGQGKGQEPQVPKCSASPSPAPHVLPAPPRTITFSLLCSPSLPLSPSLLCVPLTSSRPPRVGPWSPPPARRPSSPPAPTWWPPSSRPARARPLRRRRRPTHPTPT